MQPAMRSGPLESTPTRLRRPTWSGQLSPVKCRMPRVSVCHPVSGLRSIWTCACAPEATKVPSPAIRASSQDRAAGFKAPSSARIAAGEEGQPLEQVDVLFVLQQRAVQRRDHLFRVALRQDGRIDVLVDKELDPVDQLRGRRLLTEPRHLTHVVEDAERLIEQPLLE